MKTDKQKMEALINRMNKDFDKLRNRYVPKMLPILQRQNINLSSVEIFVEKLQNMPMLYARIYDRLDGKIKIESRGSMRKKMRKALWYLIP